MDFISELKWRGMLHSMVPGTEEKLKSTYVTGYAGFDPTAPSLQIGNLVAIMLLVHLQRAGHKPIVLVGGATGMVGDPSGKSEERNLLTEEEVFANQSKIKEQLEKFLDFDGVDNSAEIVNNYDWFKEFKFLDFLRDVGKHLTVSYMLAKDSVKQRMESGISFTEFSYQLLQGYDFYWLNKEKKCSLQVGGSDQWGNMTAGCELVRRKSGNEVFAVTCPLVTKTDGTKFGKSAAGEKIWLDPNLTSPYKFYQFWLNLPDEDIENFLKVFTLKNEIEIKEILKKHNEAPHLRIAQTELAEDVTTRVHSKEACELAVATSKILFGKADRSAFEGLSRDDMLAIFEGVPQFEVPQRDFDSGITVADLLCEKSTVFNSKGELRRMVKNNGLSINKEKINNTEEIIGNNHLLCGEFILIQKGKKNYTLLKVC